MSQVAFLGTGLLGSAMVEGMLRRGDAVTVNPDDGETIAAGDELILVGRDDRLEDLGR